MSTQINKFREEYSKTEAFFDTTRRYLNCIKLSKNPDAKEAGTVLLAKISLPSGARNICDYHNLSRDEAHCSARAEVLEFPLEDIIHDISMFLAKGWTFLMSLALDMDHWLRLNIPKVEDGNNVGGEIIESILSDIEKFKEKISAVEEFDTEQCELRVEISDTFYTQKKHRKDIIRFLHTIDFNHFNQFEINIKEILLEIDFIFDKCEKNIEKITNPRNNTALRSMY